MHRRIPRLVGALGLALALTCGTLAGSAFANPAPLGLTGQNLSPAFVSNGALAAFTVTATNNGPSNISQLYLTGPADAPVYGVDAYATVSGVVTPLSGVCTTSGQLLCSFGAVRALDSVTVTVAVTTPSKITSWVADFEWSTTGYVNGKNSSHGDAFPFDFPVMLTTDKDHAGTYVWDANQTQVADTSIDRRNPQSTKVNVTVTKIPLSVQDGSAITCGGYDLTCPTTFFGETSVVNVDNDQFQSNLFVIVIQVYHGPNANQVNGVYHSWNTDGTPTGNHDETIGLCTTSTPTSPCVQPQNLQGGNLQLTIYTYHNGNYRGY